MTVTRGTDQTFIGMDIKFLENGKVRIFMKYYIIESIEVFECFGQRITNCTNAPTNFF